MVSIRDRRLEERPLNRQQWCVAGRLVVDAPIRLIALGHLCQRLHGLMQEQVFWRETQAEAACAADRLDRQDRVAAKLEEVVGRADALDAEDVLPDLRKQGLGIVARGDVAFGFPYRGGQRTAVELAVGRDREPLERDDLSRHHMVGQLCLEPVLDRRGVDGVQHAVGHQLVLTDDHRGILDFRL